MVRFGTRVTKAMYMKPPQVNGKKKALEKPAVAESTSKANTVPMMQLEAVTNWKGKVIRSKDRKIT